MWIAKPISSLTTAEETEWSITQSVLRGGGIDVPLSQTLAWGRAVNAVSGCAYLIHNSAEHAGGLVFSQVPTGGSYFECVNGPLLDWDAPERATRQLATFAHAVARLSAGFETLSATPRWRLGCETSRLEVLAVEPTDSSEAATIVVPLDETEDGQLKVISPRFRRTLARGRRDGHETQWTEATAENVVPFVSRMQRFGREKGFYVPELEWFQALVSEPARRKEEYLTFWLASACTVGDGPMAMAQLLIAHQADRAFFLFGFEERGEESPAACSPGITAHWRAMRESAGSGIRWYDLNGYVVDAAPDHHYAGVNRFKEQFGGEVVRYFLPRFEIGQAAET